MGKGQGKANAGNIKAKPSSAEHFTLPPFDNTKDIKPQIDNFRKWILTSATPLSKDEKLQKMKQYFGHDGMCKLWGVLKTHIKNASPEVKMHWDKLNEKKGDRNMKKNDLKNGVLINIVEKVDDWQEKFVNHVKDVSQFQKQQAKA